MSQTVLVIREETVFAAAGKEGKEPQLRELEKVELTGFGENMARWKDGISELSRRINLSQVRLVLPASVCSSKVIQVPWVKNKDLEAMAVREMQEIFRSEIMDYAVISSDKKAGITLCCVSVEEAVLRQFMKMLAELKIEVKSITGPMEGLLRVQPRMENFQDKTAVYLFFEDGAVTSVLNERGQYKYSSRSRLFSEPGTLDFGTEIVRNVSGILQFQSASRSEHTITDVYYAGCPEDDFDVSRDGLAGMNLNVDRIEEIAGVSLPIKEEIGEWMPCVGAMLNNVRGFHDINFLSSYKKNNEKENTKTEGWKHAILPAAVFLLCLLVYGVVQVMNVAVRGSIEETVEWMESEQVKEIYAEAKALEEEKEALLQDIGQVQKIKDNRETYPKLENTVIDKIEAAGGAGITSNISGYDSLTGEMTFEARSAAAIDIPSYIRRLSGTELFQSVEYTGYVYENDAYTLSLLCTLKANAEGGVEE